MIGFVIMLCVQTALLVAKNEALLMSTVAWLCSRIPKDDCTATLRRVFVLHEPFGDAVRAAAQSLEFLG